MTTDKNALLVEEQALFEQEQGLVQMEAQIHAQEQGVAQMERAFQRKNRALVSFATHVREEEASLIRRAEAIGPKARALVQELLAQGAQAGGGDALDVGKPSERQDLMNRRRENLSMRMGLLEEREALYAARTEALERAEAGVSDMETRLIRRQNEVSEAARQVFTAAAALDDDDEEGDPAPFTQRPPSTPASLFRSPTAEPTRLGPNPQAAATQVAVPAAVRVTEGPKIAGETVKVVVGATEQVDAEDALSGTSRAEDKVASRRNARARAKTNQFKITLEAHLDLGEPHHFFVYENDGPGDLPGLFIATPNILKVGREVRVRVGRAGTFLEATGIVAWQRQRGDSRGVPGMGIELLNLTDAERRLVDAWVKDRPPQMI
ncbi:MAG: hypothetical protein IT385_17205 [Deltaproteobacteria bacterium]|nr:hypothetical protein [Deltaproteobacteria bacterium]